MRRLAIALLGTAALAGFAGSAGAAGVDEPAPDDPVPTESGAASSTLTEIDADDPPPVDVFQVSGLLDEIVVAGIGDAIDRAAEQGSQALILQVDAEGAVVGDEA
ncbi:MAG: hypothetical protein WD225_04490, partial [Ilumatobacteraceae bacterium]